MNKEELLEKLDKWFETVADYGEEEDKEAYQQIKALIENQKQFPKELILKISGKVWNKNEYDVMKTIENILIEDGWELV